MENGLKEIYVKTCLIQDSVLCQKHFFGTVIFTDEEETKYNQAEDGLAIGGWFSVIPETVGEFTTYKDITDKEIFEGDFLESENGIKFLVDFRYGSWMIIHEPKTGAEREGEPKSDHLHDAIKFYKLEIIGNIHDNPELI